MRKLSKSRMAKSSKIAAFKSMLEPVETDPTQPFPNAALRGTRERPKPMEQAAFHGLVGEFVKAILPATESDPAALVIQFLAAFGNVIGRRAHFSVEEEEHYLKLFAVLVGRSARSRKGVSWSRVKARFAEIDKGWIGGNLPSGLSSGEGLIYAVRDRVEGTDKKGQPEIKDLGVIDKRLLVVEPEFARVLKVMGRESNTLSALIRQAWDNEDLQTMTRHEPLKATKPHISIIGHITEADLKRYLTETDSANGFGNRFLWICVERSKRLPRGGTPDPELVEALEKKLAKAVSFARKTSLVERSEAAENRWDEIYGALDEDAYGLYGVLTSRSEPQIMRMACIYALLDNMDLVELEHLEAAHAVWKYADASVAYIFGDRLGDPTADAILAALNAKQDAGMTRSEIHDLLARKKSKEQIDAALQTLKARGLAFAVQEETAGRPTQRWYAA